MSHQTTIERIRAALYLTFDELDQYFDLSDEIRALKPDVNEWSIDEILEHITLTSHYLLLVVQSSRDKALKRAKLMPVPDEPSDLDAILVLSDPDAFAWSRPEHMEPTGQKPLSEVRLIMRVQQRICLEILDQLPAGEGQLHQVRMSVQNLGKLDIYQWIFFLVQHARCHSEEIRRIVSRTQEI
ncbi:MAG TPA: DinB family protein [Phototrophicaceae bacterium]|jgi:hypothetical protein|nr:DinB family protein [Phototrophicaceae bacterium]